MAEIIIPTPEEVFTPKNEAENKERINYEKELMTFSNEMERFFSRLDEEADLRDSKDYLEKMRVAYEKIKQSFELTPDEARLAGIYLRTGSCLIKQRGLDRLKKINPQFNEEDPEDQEKIQVVFDAKKELAAWQINMAKLILDNQYLNSNEPTIRRVWNRVERLSNRGLAEKYISGVRSLVYAIKAINSTKNNKSYLPPPVEDAMGVDVLVIRDMPNYPVTKIAKDFGVTVVQIGASQGTRFILDPEVVGGTESILPKDPNEVKKKKKNQLARAGYDHHEQWQIPIHGLYIALEGAERGQEVNKITGLPNGKIPAEVTNQLTFMLDQAKIHGKLERRKR